jgi:hypothetical protein
MRHAQGPVGQKNQSGDEHVTSDAPEVSTRTTSEVAQVARQLPLVRRES